MKDEPLVSRPLPGDVRALLEAPNYVHLSTLRKDGRPRNHVVWVGLEGERILVCTSDSTWKAKDMRRNPRVALSVVDPANPYRMAAVQGRVVHLPEHAQQQRDHRTGREGRERHGQAPA